MKKIKFAVIEEDAVIPKRKNPTDAGIDLFVFFQGSEYLVYPDDVVIFRTGVTVDISKGYFGWITNKSSKDYLIGGGIVDQDYQGELLVKVINTSTERLYFHHGDAVAQLLIVPCVTPEIEVVSPLEIHKNKTNRGKDGGIAKQADMEKSFTHDRPEPRTSPPTSRPYPTLE